MQQMKPSLKDIVKTLSKLVDDVALNEKVVVNIILIDFIMQHVKGDVHNVKQEDRAILQLNIDKIDDKLSKLEPQKSKK
jgi:hypothetical protein